MDGWGSHGWRRFPDPEGVLSRLDRMGGSLHRKLTAKCRELIEWAVTAMQVHTILGDTPNRL